MSSADGLLVAAELAKLLLFCEVTTCANSLSYCCMLLMKSAGLCDPTTWIPEISEEAILKRSLLNLQAGLWKGSGIGAFAGGRLFNMHFLPRDSNLAEYSLSNAARSRRNYQSTSLFFAIIFEYIFYLSQLPQPASNFLNYAESVQSALCDYMQRLREYFCPAAEMMIQISHFWNDERRFIEPIGLVNSQSKNDALFFFQGLFDVRAQANDLLGASAYLLHDFWGDTADSTSPPALADDTRLAGNTRSTSAANRVVQSEG